MTSVAGVLGDRSRRSLASSIGLRARRRSARRPATSITVSAFFGALGFFARAASSPPASCCRPSSRAPSCAAGFFCALRWPRFFAVARRLVGAFFYRGASRYHARVAKNCPSDRAPLGSEYGGILQRSRHRRSRYAVPQDRCAARGPVERARGVPAHRRGRAARRCASAATTPSRSTSIATSTSRCARSRSTSRSSPSTAAGARTAASRACSRLLGHPLHRARTSWRRRSRCTRARPRSCSGSTTCRRPPTTR